jgi:hypothetical protein
MKLIKYFEDITDDKKRLGFIKNFAPRLPLLISQTDRLEDEYVLTQKLNNFKQSLSKVFIEKMNPFMKVISPKDKGMLSQFKDKFEHISSSYDVTLNKYLGNQKNEDDTEAEDIVFLNEIFFYCFLLHSIIKKSEEILKPYIKKEPNFFEDAYKKLFSVFEHDEFYQKILDTKSSIFFKKGLTLSNPFSNHLIFKNIKKTNKEHLKKIKDAENIQNFYLNYIGSKNKFDFKYKCISSNKKTGIIYVKNPTPFDLTFEEYNDSGSNNDEYKLIESSLNEGNNLLSLVKNKKEPQYLEGLKQLFFKVDDSDLKKASQVEFDSYPVVKLELLNNKEILLNEEQGVLPFKCTLKFIKG